MTDINDFGRKSFVTHTTGLKERMKKRTMTEQEKILAVLDMSEDEQWKWLYDNHHELVSYLHIIDKQKHLADLAFRLRDEAVEYQGWGAALVDVWTYFCNQNNRHLTLEAFWIHIAKPIHWIVAALLAKESK